MNLKYTTLVFDLDGTLMDTLDDLFLSANFALKKQMLPIRTKEEVRQFVGNGVKKLIERAVPVGTDAVVVESVLSSFKTYYSVHCKDHSAPYAGIVGLLSALKDAGYKMAIVSNKPDAEVKRLNKEYFSDYISVAIGENEAAGISKKPAPDMVREALRLLHSEKRESVYVGDSDVDILTARNSGMACVSVSWGFRGKAFLLAHGAEVVVDEPAEIKKLVDGNLN